MPRKTDKRVRLVIAAKDLMHKQGFNLTTLADIAQEADVPLGNVYYYFKTKEAIGVAVIELLSSEIAEFLKKLDDTITDAKGRLFGLIQSMTVDLERTARFGCAIGGLCQELGKQGGSLADQAAKLLHDMLAWSEAQFRTLGITDKAADYALHLIACIQGMQLMTHTFKDPKMALREVKTLQDWLDKLAGSAKSGSPVGRSVTEAA